MLVLAEDHRNTVEKRLWEAVLALDEAVEIAERLGLRFGDLYNREANDRREQAAVIRDILNDVTVSSREKCARVVSASNSAVDLQQ